MLKRQRCAQQQWDKLSRGVSPDVMQGKDKASYMPHSLPTNVQPDAAMRRNQKHPDQETLSICKTMNVAFQPDAAMRRESEPSGSRSHSHARQLTGYSKYQGHEVQQ